MLRSAVRVLGPSDLDEVLAILSRDPVSDVFVAARVELGGLEPGRSGGELWGWGEHGHLESLCWSGANLVPVQAGEQAVRAFADRARRAGRRCSSIVGPSYAVDRMWELLRPHWGPARDVRQGQPLMAIDDAPLLAPDPGVRLVQPDELDVLLPACVAMFTEEIGVSPTVGDGGALYRARVAELIETGRAFARIENGEVVFKAEIGAASRAACQVQGVWVHPSLRGRGLSGPGMAAVVRLARERIAPLISLYVNDYNIPARRSYERVGFRQVGTFTSVLF